MEQTRKVEFKLNGKNVSILISQSSTLLEVLRDQLEMTGTKEGCTTGDCGACTVLLDGEPINSCLVPAVRTEGCDIETIEGIGSKGNLHPIQHAIIEHGAIQCGYCTPGMILTIKTLLEQDSSPSQDKIKQAISGNLCRCGSYPRIIDAINSLATETEWAGNE